MNETFTLNERVVVDYEDVKAGLDDILEEVRTLRSDSLIRQILSKEDLEKIRSWEKLIGKRADEKFTIVVMGDFKRGKSTLINALLGASIAPMDVSPETITINKISYSDQPRREAVLRNGRRIRLNATELNRAELEKIMGSLPAPIDTIEIHENIALLKEITIVDTPGLGDLMNLYNAQVQDYLANADAVIYVVSALSPLSESEQVYLCSSILPQNFSKLFFAANMSDCFDRQEDIEKVRREIENRVAAFSSNAKVYSVSALDEYCRKMGFNRPNGQLAGTLEVRFAQFNDDIREEMILRKDLIKAQRLISLAKIMSKDIRNRINMVGSMLSQSRENLEEISRRCDEENANLHNTLSSHHQAIRDSAAQLGYEAKRWMTEFLRRLRVEIESAKKTDVVTIQKHFQFYIMDVIREAILCCISAHKPVMEEKLYSIAKDFSAKHLFEEAGSSRFTVSVNIADISWTAVDTFSFILQDGMTLIGANQLIGSSIISYVGMAIAGFVRQSKQKDKQADLLGPLLANFSAIETTVFDQIASAYDKVADNACSMLTKLFEAEIESSRNAAEQAINISENKEMDHDQIDKQLSNATLVLNHIDMLISRYE